MHEVGIMTEAVRLAVESARARGASRIYELRLRVGALSGAVPEALRFAFDAVTAGTIAQGASLAIEAVPAVWWCRGCAAEFGAEGPLAQCPRCGAWSGELRAGRELDIASIEVS
jgi:hydrogenase nickel incorporation protein HypA/HybF